MTTRDSRLRGLMATLTLLAFVAGVPTILVAIRAIPDLSAFSWSQLTAPDDGTLALEILTEICWIAWALFTCQLIVSIASRVRGIRTPRLPGLVVPQLAADRLVAAAALLFVAVPTATALLPQPRADAAADPLAESASASAWVSPAIHPRNATGVVAETDAPSPAPAVPAQPPGLEAYTVKRGDSLWRIAEQRLGDGARYIELVKLNKDVLDNHPSFLLPGTLLRIPATQTTDHNPDPDADIETPRTYIVQPGDRLSEIAENELGAADAYPDIFDASRATVQPDQRRLTDPDLIFPGWKLTIPAQEQPAESPAPQHIQPLHEDNAPRPSSAPTEITPPASVPTAPTPTESPNATTHEQAIQRQSSVDNDRDNGGDTRGDESDADIATPSWLAPGLAGAGSILGGALWLAMRAKRRTQLRYRRPGTVIAAPPEELRAVEKTARATASVLAPRIDALDTALRSLPPGTRIVSALLDAQAITLTLPVSGDLPAPWRGSVTSWQLCLTDVPVSQEGSFPPYPLLVSVGRADDGSFVFLNLEELRTVTVAGNVERKADFARHLAAELAVNPWSVVTNVDLLGLGPGLASFNLGRVCTHRTDDTGFIAELASTVSTVPHVDDPDDFHVAIIATAKRPAGDLEELAEAIEGISGRCFAALVDLAGEPRSTGTHLQVTADGRLRADSLGIEVTVAGLSDEEARAAALLLDITLDQAITPVPPAPEQTAVTDLGGALVEGLVEPRSVEPGGERSLLPLDALVYAEAAATTPEDIEILAPRTTTDARSVVAASDPTLDEDLARWDSPTLTATQLTLLGPVGARTTGDAKSTANRRPFYVELLAYLVLHPAGVRASQVADAFGIRPERVRVDISQLRRWLGTNPSTGQPYLPKSANRPVPDSPTRYRVEGVLCDLDLFRRLRARGQSRGADGIDDLTAALRLVSGEPFSELREGHWNWLLDGERWDHIMTGAIVDVGHVVTTQALAAENHDLALWAAQVAYTASPYDEIAQLDIIAADRAGGDDAQADRALSEKVFNRRDDDLPPIELPPRTVQVVRDKNWGTLGRRRRTG